MNTKRMILSIILTGAITQPLMAKKQIDIPAEIMSNKELILKALRISRALFDIAGGLAVMNGARSEASKFNFLTFEGLGISLLAHGSYDLYKQVSYSDLQAAYAYLYNYFYAKAAVAQADLPAPVQAEVAPLVASVESTLPVPTDSSAPSAA